MSKATIPALAIENLEFTWPGRDGFSISVEAFSVAPGERILLTAPSGAGKSTLIALISGILVAQRGSIAVGGIDLARLNPSQRDGLRAEQIGLIFQSFNLISYLTALDNILLPLSFAPDRLRRAGGWAAAEKTAGAMLEEIGLPFAEIARKKAANLSIGQQQRVAVLRALIGSPPLIIADEPTSALDSDRQQAFLAMLDDQLDRTGSALLMVSHDPGLTARFDRTVPLASFNRTGSMR